MHEPRHESHFLSDIRAIRERARRHIEQGAVTASYGADRPTAIRLLNEALATEIVCTLRYRRHYYMAQGIHAQSVAQEFLEHADEEQQHADRLAKRIVQLGGEPDLSPQGLAERSHAEYVEGGDLVDMLREDLIAERIAIESYTEMARWFGEGDPTSRRLVESILEVEEEHAEDLATLLASHAPGRGEDGDERSRARRGGEGRWEPRGGRGGGPPFDGQGDGPRWAR